MIEKGLLQLVTTDSGVSALIPKDVGGTPQVYWLLAPKGAKAPYIILSRVTTKDTYDMVGDTDLREGLFQVDCYTDSTSGVSGGYYACRAIADAVRDLLKNFRGALPDTDATKVQATFLDKDWDMPYQEGAKGFTFRVMLHFRVHFIDA
jgi:hypothetical protein